MPADCSPGCTARSSSGRIILSAYVGPGGFEYPERRLEIVRRYRRLLPIGLRFDPETGRRLPREPRVAGAADVLALARSAFVEEALYRGGGLLQQLLSGPEPRIARSPLEARLVEVLGAAEEDLHARGVVPDDFAIFVGRRRAGDRVT